MLAHSEAHDQHVTVLALYKDNLLSWLSSCLFLGSISAPDG